MAFVLPSDAPSSAACIEPVVSTDAFAIEQRTMPQECDAQSGCMVFARPTCTCKIVVRPSWKRVGTKHSDTGPRRKKAATETSAPWREDVRTLPSERARLAGDVLASEVFEQHLRLYQLARIDDRLCESDGLPRVGFMHQLHAMLRAHKSLLRAFPGECAFPGDEDTYQRAARCLREHRSMMMSTRPVSFGTVQEVDCAVEDLLHSSMEEHCWTAVADVAKQVQEWATDLADNRSADVSCQLSTLKQGRR